MNKIDEKTARLFKWMNRKPQPPYTIELIPTNRCNFNCKSCWRQNISKKEIEKTYSQEMSDERLLKLIDEAAEIDVKEIAFVGGGEPLCRDVSIELLKKIRKKNIEGDLVTNGSLVTEELSKILVNISWTRVKFSIDGSCSELQDQLRGKKCFEDIVKNIKFLSEIKRKKESDFPKIGFNVVISNQNYRDLKNIVELGHEVGCNEILLLPITVFSEEGKNLKMNYDQMVQFQGIIKECIPRLKKYKIFSNMDKFIDLRYVENTNKMHEVMMEEADKALIRERLRKGKKLIEESKKDLKENFMTVPCFEPWSHVTILPDGKIACCFNNYVWETDVSIKNKSLKELWYGKYFDKFRNEILTRKLSKACATCCVWRVFESKSIREKLRSYNSSIMNKIKMRL